MYIDLSSQPLPQIFKRKGRECYLDPIREKLIFITPEETVRQQVISHLLYDLKVPADMISVEENLAHYGIKSIRRTDITIKCLTKEGGVLNHNRNWNLDDPDVVKLMENLIAYALVRDEYRAFVKKHK